MPELQYICSMGKMLILLLLFTLQFQAQTVPVKDLDLLKKGFGSAAKKKPGPPFLNDRKPLQTKHKDAFSKGNPLVLVLKGSMLVYQHVISPQLSSGCIYERSCSNYAKEAIRKTGLIRGVLLAADRLTRCNRSTLRYIPGIYINTNGKAIDEPCIHFHE